MGKEIFIENIRPSQEEPQQLRRLERGGNHWDNDNKLLRAPGETGQLENTFISFTSDNGAEEGVIAGGIFRTGSGSRQTD